MTQEQKTKMKLVQVDAKVDIHLQENAEAEISVEKQRMPWLRQGNQWVNEAGDIAVSRAGLERAAVNMFLRAPLQGLAAFGTFLPIGGAAVLGSQAIVAASQTLPGAAGLAAAGVVAPIIALPAAILGIAGGALLGAPAYAVEGAVQKKAQAGIAPDPHDQRTSDTALINNAISFSVNRAEPAR